LNRELIKTVKEKYTYVELQKVLTLLKSEAGKLFSQKELALRGAIPIVTTARIKMIQQQQVYKITK
jgi:hypothetical protein